MTPPLLHRVAGDDALVRRAAAGDDDAFATLVRRYEPRLTAYCGSLLRNEEDARDAVQNALLKAVTALRRDGGAAVAFRPWVFRIAHNEAVSLVRRRRPTDELPDALPAHGDGPTDALLVREEVRAILDAVRELPDRARHALLLRELAGLEYAEVAGVLGVSPGGARQAVFEARVALVDDRAGQDAPCHTIRAELSDGDRRRRPTRRVRGHLRGCGSCRSWSQAQRRRHHRLSGLPAAAGLPLLGSAWASISGLFGGAGGAGVTAKVATSLVAVVAATPVAVETAQHERRAPQRHAVAAVAAAPTTTAKAAATARQTSTHTATAPATAAVAAPAPTAVATPATTTTTAAAPALKTETKARPKPATPVVEAQTRQASERSAPPRDEALDQREPAVQPEQEHRPVHDDATAVATAARHHDHPHDVAATPADPATPEDPVTP